MLVLLAVLESLAMVFFTYGFDVALLPLLAGVLALACLYTLIGLAFVVRFASITDFLMPSLVVITLFQLPALDVFGIWQSPLFYLHPVHGPLLLLNAAFTPGAAWQMVYAVLASAFWVGVAFWWSRRAFEHYVIQ
ncbi:MAG: ABC transporter permease, partial [Verrucomicrobiae bacterium]|nr:ABC transporter permease [Verrucomicrobiae bacterium]